MIDKIGQEENDFFLENYAQFEEDEEKYFEDQI